jgi:hypothetical protein
MNFRSVEEFLNRLSFRHVVWLFPVAFSIHVLEEVCCFTQWAQTYASPAFTFSHYLTIHIAGIVLAFVAALILWLYANKILVFLFFAFMFAPAVFWNVFFHAGATAYFGVYCPGVITAVVIYLPLFALTSLKAVKERLLTNGAGLIALSVAGVFHTLEVGHNVFRAW